MWENGREIDWDYVQEVIINEEFLSGSYCIVYDRMQSLYDFYKYKCSVVGENMTLENVVEAYLETEKNHLKIVLELNDNYNHQTYFDSKCNMEAFEKLASGLGMFLTFIIDLNKNIILEKNILFKKSMSSILKNNNLLECLGEIEDLDLSSLEIQLMFGNKVNLLKPELKFVDKTLEWVEKYISINYEEIEYDFSQTKENISKRLGKREKGIYYC